MLIFVNFYLKSSYYLLFSSMASASKIVPRGRFSKPNSLRSIYSNSIAISCAFLICIIIYKYYFINLILPRTGRSKRLPSRITAIPFIEKKIAIPTKTIVIKGIIEPTRARTSRMNNHKP